MKRKMMKIKWLIVLIAGLMAAEISLAQNASYPEIMSDLKKVQKNFSTPAGVYASCSVKYLYSTKSSPAGFVDSLNGLYKSYGQNHYTKIGNTETIQNDSMALVVYNDDKMIMGGAINRTSKKERGLFLNAMDSEYVAHNAGVMTITRKGDLKVMEFRFSDSSQYYDCRLTYASDSYVPTSIRYTLRKAVRSGSAPADDDPGLITIEFLNYSRAPFDESVLDVNKYIRVTTAGSGTLQPAYSSYQWIEQGKIGSSVKGN